MVSNRLEGKNYYGGIGNSDQALAFALVLVYVVHSIDSCFLSSFPMKNKSLVTWLGTGAIALSFAVLPSILPASAQTTTDDPVEPVGTVVTTDDGFDWGWLGLLGLLGLAGLKGRDRDRDRVTHVDHTTTTPRTSATSTMSNNPRY